MSQTIKDNCQLYLLARYKTAHIGQSKANRGLKGYSGLSKAQYLLKRAHEEMKMAHTELRRARRGF